MRRSAPEATQQRWNRGRCLTGVMAS